MDIAEVKSGPSATCDSSLDSVPGPSTSYAPRPQRIPDSEIIDLEKQLPYQTSDPNQDGLEIVRDYSHTSKQRSLEGWTKTDKFDLLQALKAYGSHDIDSIQESLPAKSAVEIISAIKFYRKKAKACLKTGNYDHKKTKQSAPRLPLACWAKYLTDQIEFNQLQTETANVLRLIAEYEDIPRAISTGNIDFRRIYHSIANALEGKPIEDDKLTSLVLDKCITECSLLSKRFLKSSQLKTIVANVDVKRRTTASFSKSNDNKDLRAVRHLIEQANLNPLKIREEFLKANK